MKKWKPAPETAARALAAVVAPMEGIERRKMFGYDCAFVGGNMFVGLHEVGLVIRLPESARNEFTARYGASSFEPMPGRVMREYVVAPERLLSVQAELRQWVGRSLSYGKTLPVKESPQPKTPEKKPLTAPSNARQRGVLRGKSQRPRTAPKTDVKDLKVVTKRRILRADESDS